MDEGDIQPIAPLKRELARVEREQIERTAHFAKVSDATDRPSEDGNDSGCGMPSPVKSGTHPTTEPEYERDHIPGTSNVLIKLMTGRTFQLPGNPTHGEILAACYAFAAGLCQGKRVGLREAFHLIEDVAEKIQEEV